MLAPIRRALPRPRPPVLDEPEVLFQGIRRRFTLRYSAVLALTLLLFSTALYFTVRQSLLGPVDDSLHRNMNVITSSPAIAFGPFAQTGCPRPPGIDNTLYACFDSRGNLLYGTDAAQQYPKFLGTSIAHGASSHGKSYDTVNVGRPLGLVRRYALRVTASDGSFTRVLVVGVLTGSQLDALHNLLIWLIILGVATVVLTSASGFYLAHRALLPARVAQERQRAFIADASHELRTPLTILRADADVLLRGRARLSEDDSELLEDMVAETSHMARLADSMLNLARLDSGNGHIEQEVVDLADLGGDIARRAAPLAAERDVTIGAGALESAVVLGDRLLLEQAVLILIDNAIKYNRPGGSIDVRTSRREDRVVLEIQDTGIGVEAADLPNLGRRFYRVDKARSREMGGAGLGISIARGIATRHGGWLELSSEPGAGTTAALSLPAA